MLFGADTQVLSLGKAAQSDTFALFPGLSAAWASLHSHVDIFPSSVSGEQSAASSLKVFGVFCEG